MSRVSIILVCLLIGQGAISDNLFYREEKRVKIELGVVNPCEALNHVRPYREETALEKVFHNNGHHRFMNAVFDYLKTQCDESFDALTRKSMNDLQSYSTSYSRIKRDITTDKEFNGDSLSRPKRSIAHVAGFVVKTVFEYALTNFVSSISEQADSSSSMDVRAFKDSLYALTKNRLSAPEGVSETRISEIQAISPSAAHHFRETEEFAPFVNPLLWAYQLTINEIIAGAADIETIAHYARQGQLATEEVGELLNDLYISSLKPEETQVLSIQVQRRHQGFIVSISFLEQEKYYIMIPSIVFASILTGLLLIGLIMRILRKRKLQPVSNIDHQQHAASPGEGESSEIIMSGKITSCVSNRGLGSPNSQRFESGEQPEASSLQPRTSRDSRASMSTVSVNEDERLSQRLDESRASMSTVSVNQDLQLSRHFDNSLDISTSTAGARLSTSTISVNEDQHLSNRIDDSLDTDSPHLRARREERMLAWRRQTTVVTRHRGRHDLSLECEGMRYDHKYSYREHPFLNFGRMNRICPYCKAIKFQREPDGLCCSEGTVVCQAIDPPPGFLDTLFDYDRPQSKKFIEHIRRYNACFAMTSMGVRGFIDERAAPMTFRIQGQVYHRIGRLLPEPNIPPTYLQIYFMGDSEVQIDRRTNLFEGVDRNIVAAWQSVLQRSNKLIRSFKTLIDSSPRAEQRIVLRSESIPQGEHPGRFHLPTNEQVAVLMIDGEYNQRDIVLKARDNRLQRIYETHRYYDALQYPIIFWRGQETYHFGLKRVDQSTGLPTSAKMSSMDVYQYHLMPRSDHRNYLLRCGPLLNQFIVDMWVKIESERLRYLRMNQASLRADTYSHLTDAIAADRDPNDIGTRIILPSTFIGSPRHMHEYAQDAMAFVGQHGGPDLFITVTCNPNWPEIRENLFMAQTALERHDIVARVFRQKLLVIRDLIKVHNIFGSVKGWMYSVEWQKRGLPHAHMLFWLNNRLRPEQIDSVISAELPDPHTDPQLYNTITSLMIHGPCGSINRNAVCTDERGLCSKKYPRSFLIETVTGDDGYPCYRRRPPTEGGRSFVKSFRGDRFTIDNRWVVPHSPLLCRMLDCHINVEYCTSVKSIKYLFKYVTKGSDLAILELRSGNANRGRVANVPAPEHQEVDENDEITLYQVGRYVSTDEAIWRIYGFKIHDRYPNIVKLQVHLENGQRVQFNPANARAVSDRGPPKTTLTAFFNLNQTDYFAKTLLYREIPTYYVWNARLKAWAPRKDGVPVQGHLHVTRGDTIGRVYGVHPNYHDCFHLRLLLNHVKGPTSFIDIRTVNGKIWPTYREACLDLNLLESDAHWIGALNEAARCRMPSHMRQLLATILCYCGPSDPMQLWLRFRNDLSEDILHRERRRRNQHVDFNENIYNSSLIALEDMTLSMRNLTLAELGLPSPTHIHDNDYNNEIERELNYDRDEMQSFYDENASRMVPDQQVAFNRVMSAIGRDEGGIFFLDAPGGTGKTFLINLILNQVRLRDEIAVAAAASGIASTLLFGGRTAHSSFNLPLKADKEPRVTLSASSAKAQMLKRCKLIVWDECTMVNKVHLESLDLTLQDITKKKTLMGGIVILLSGDFRQTLPVIKRGTPADAINACLKRSKLWRHVIRLTLSTNMRVHLRGDLNAARFSSQLLEIGNGTYPFMRGDTIRLTPELCCSVKDRTQLLEKVFPNFLTNLSNKDWLAERALLAPLNETVDDLNSVILNRLPGRQRTYLSMDTTSDPEDVVHYPVEVLNSLTPSGMPPHSLTLKEGAVIMLIRNFRPPQTCNGTLFYVRKLHNHMIEAENLKGAFKGEIVFIPRFPLDSDELFVKFRRRQFPVRVAFALSINKSQGQSYKIVGVDLSKPCFSHGQLYVAFSRVGSPSCLYVQTNDGTTKNIVFNRALR